MAPERIFVAPNTLDTGTLRVLHEELEREGRQAVRRRLGLEPGVPVIVFLGRLIKAKGTDQLLQVFGMLRKRHPQATLVVIGDGPERAAVRAGAGKLGGIVMLGALTSLHASAPYLYAADVLLNPGYVGLSINHAFALGLPVVSQQSPDPRIRYHSPEIAYLEPGRNGLLTPFGNTFCMVDAVEQILANRAWYASNASAYARSHLGLDTMIDGIVQAVNHVEGRAAGDL